MNQILTSNKISEVPGKVADWLLDSSIVVRDSSNGDYGGVFAWLSGVSAKKSFIYSEITGYYLTWLCYHANFMSTDTLVLRIKTTADWLINRALNEEETGFWYKKYEGESDFRRLVYWFDNCMVINGLVHAYTVLGDIRYLEISRKLLNLFISEIDAMKYTIPWSSDHSSNETQEEQWSRRNGTFLLKCLVSLMNFSQVTKQPAIRELICSCLDKYASYQTVEGNFVTNSNNATYLHPHLYTLEAYWAYGALTKNKHYIQISKKGVDWILERFNTVGYSGYFASDGKPLIKGVGSDALAQTIRLMTLMSYPKNETAYLINLLIDRYYSVNHAGLGSFKYGYIIENKWKNDRNCWSSMFAQQAFDLFDNDSRRKLLLINPTYLI